MSPVLWAVVPAAGAATRFGGGKLTADIDGRPLIERTLRSLLGAGIDVVVLVASGRDAFAGVSAALDPRVRTVVNPEPSRGMFSSVQCGLAAVSDDARLVAILPADMPFIQSATIRHVIAEAGSGGRQPATDGGGNEAFAMVPSVDGRRGHPVVVPASVGRELLRQPASTSLKAALVALHVPLREIVVDDAGILRDVDVKEDLPPRIP